MSEAENRIQVLVDNILRGEVRAISGAITSVENRDSDSHALLKLLFPRTGKASLIGITGPAGAGKSTLVDGLASFIRAQGHSIGILAIDPSSPFSGGAILGDRVRMQAHASASDIFIRSMATRGTLGGISSATMDAAMILDAAGKDFILIETVGVGQDEVEIIRLADVTLVLAIPGTGDDVQAFKAGLMEIADIFVLNKSDLPGTDRVEQEIRSLLSLAPESQVWSPEIIRTVATQQEGLANLWQAISRYLAFSRERGIFTERRKQHWQYRIVSLLQNRLLDQLLHHVLPYGALDEYAAQVASRQSDPYEVTDRILKQSGHLNP